MALINTVRPIKARGEMLSVGDNVNLTVQFKDPSGNLIDADSFPKISINSPASVILLAATSVGVTHVSTGKYSYLFTVPDAGPLGVFNDTWLAYINGFRVQSEFSFIVANTQVPAINLDGYINLGDDPGFNYSQDAIKNINKLIKSLKMRLRSSGKTKSIDGYGNTIYVDCDIFSVDLLTTALATALVDFNQVPYYTFFSFSENAFVDQFGEIIVEGATLYALAGSALLHKGSEYSISDNGITFNLPTVSEMLSSQYSTLLTAYTDKLKMIKNSLRPAPKSLGIFSMTSNGNSPQIARLRHFRQRRIL